MHTLPNSLHKFFWDTDPTCLNLKEHRQYIISRLLHMGDEESLIWLNHTYSHAEIKNSIKNSRELTNKDKTFFNLIY